MTEFEDRELDGSQNGSHGFVVTAERDQEGVRIRIVGELDIATAPELERALEDCAGVGPGRLLIDLEGLEFMDSTGLASIIRAQLSADQNGHRLVLRRGSPQVQHLFELTGILDRLTFED